MSELAAVSDRRVRAHAAHPERDERTPAPAATPRAWRGEPLTPASGAPFLPAFASGLVALAPNPFGLRYAMAPAVETAALIRRHGLDQRGDIAVMTRDDYRRMLRLQAGPEIAQLAAGGLTPGTGPSASAAWRRGPWIMAWLVAAAAALGVAAPWVALGLAGLLTMPIFLMLVLLRCAASIEAMRLAPPRPHRLRDAELPLYTVLAPVHRETAVIPQFVRALNALDYPRDRLEIKFLVEADDAQTLGALKAARLPGHMEIVVVPPGQPRTKPRALNAGLLEARGQLVTIYDAEDRPDPRQLRTAANLFARMPASVACLQGRLVIDNVDDGWLTRMFALEYAGLFDIVNAGLIQAGLPVLLGGTSNHFRIEPLRQVGGWDACNVTEDAELAFRLCRAGFSIADLPSATLEEAPARFGSWRRQRTRWMKGFLQTMLTHGRHPRRLLREAGVANGLTLLSLCGGTLVSALCYPVFLALTGLTLLIWGLPPSDSLAAGVMLSLWCVLFMAGLVAIYAPAILGARRRGLTDLWLSILLKPIYCCLISVAAWAAVAELFTAPTRWNKTEHGLAKTSRAAAAVRRPPR